MPHNEYAQGVLDAVAYLLHNKTTRKDLEELRDMILEGSAKDFKTRLEPRAF